MADRTDEDNGDYLGYSVYAETLWHRIEAALNKDVAHREAALREDKTPPPLGDDPLVVGLFGEWGAGKSKLLSLIQKLAEAQRKKQIEEHQLDGYKAITVPVFFQPWKYEHEKHLLVPLLLHILVELENTLAKARNGEDSATSTALAVVEGAKSVLGSALKKVGDLTQAVGQVLGVADPIATAPLAAMVQMLAHGTGELLAGKARRRTAREFAHADNGRSYYDLHRILSEVTRPAKHPHVTGDQHHDKDFCINFVIFIDDLDRCLPEKAVETLELIKTVFNLESFAFVLALDEEVVERGIGHRYKDYALQNKKPEMPITGFEYLEKIVHLPFRLPGLTGQQAANFLAEYERSHVLSGANPSGYQPQPWMAPRVVPIRGGRPMATGGIEAKENCQIDLAAFVVNSFDAYVPRKLVRVVELFHQTLAVLHHRKRLGLLQVGGVIDPRVLMAFVLLQLFQPELYRACRRSLTGFNALLNAMKEPDEAKRSSRPAARALSKRTSDADLWHWAVGWVDASPPVSQRSALMRLPSLQAEERHEAQRIQLPLVARLVEHREAQRHVFDPLRLFEQLKPLHQEVGAGEVNSQAYFGLLALMENDQDPVEREWTVLVRAEATQPPDLSVQNCESLEVVGLETQPADQPTMRTSKSVTDIAWDVGELYTVLASGLPSEKKRLYEKSRLGVGDMLPDEVVQTLLTRADQDSTELTSSRPKELPLWRSRVLEGLTYLARHLDGAAHGADWWRLVQGAIDERHWGQFKNQNDLVLHARWSDVRGALGQDSRFDATASPSPLYLPVSQLDGHDQSREPLPGFVWVQKERADFKPKEGGCIELAPFLMARYLTTVDQFAAFVDGGGYGAVSGEKPDWWDSQGWAWVTGEWDRHVSTPEWLRKRLSQRPLGERQNPARWTQQRPWGSRPVWGVNWFEARAYVNWLNAQDGFREQLKQAGLGQARVQLPIEMQWERAARAAGFDTPPDEREYVWNDAKAAVERRANVRESGLGQASPVGLFPSSPLGICDLNGNLWEWQDNLYAVKGSVMRGERIRPITSPLGAKKRQSDWLEMTDDPSDSASPALRGGAWYFTGEFARASFRYGNPPVNWFSSVGFRLVLSLDQ